MPAKYFRVDGIATHVVHTGRTTLPDVPPDCSRGRAVLCLHGSGGNAGTFAALLERLAGAHSPLAFDQPGHARSGGLDSLGSVERMAAFTRGVMDALGLERPVLLGHSLGGAVALQLARDAPRRVAALVLLGCAARFPSADRARAAGGEDETVAQVRRVTQGRERRRFDRSAWSPGTPDEVVHRGFFEDARTDPRVVLGDLLAVRAWDGRPGVAAVEAPALVAWGEDEDPELAARARALADALPGAHGLAVPAAGHMLHAEQPDVVAGAVLDFLAELPA